jgi:hypothetical protein
MNNRILLLFSLIFVFTSCKKDLFQFNYSEKKRLKIEELEFDYLQAKSKLKYDDGFQNFSANATIRIRQDSLIWISISSTGVEAIRSIIQIDSIFVIDRLNKEYRQFSFDSLQRTYNIPIDFEMVQAALIGNLIRSRKNNDKVLKDEDFFILKQKSENLDIDNFVNSKTMKIEKVKLMDAPSESIMEIKYEDFQLHNDVLIPFENSVFLTYNRNNSELISHLNINFSRVAINEKKIKFPFNVPNRYVSKE